MPSISTVSISDFYSEFGGDPTQIYLMGHSAGAHLCCLTMTTFAIHQVKRMAINVNSQVTKLLKPFPILESEMKPVKGMIMYYIMLKLILGFLVYTTFKRTTNTKLSEALKKSQ